MRTVPHAGRLFLTLWILFAFFADPMPEISTVRYLYLARAVAESGTFRVDDFAHASRGDLAVHEGALYSGVPPAIGLALWPLAEVVEAGAPYLPLSPNQALQVLSLWAWQAPLAATALLLLAGLFIDLGLRPGHATAVAMTLGLGTPLFFFTSKLSDYPLAAFLMVVAGRIAVTWRRDPSSTRHAALAGMTIGLAWALNDLAALLTALFLALGSGRAPLRTWAARLGPAVAGSLPALAARGAYMAACFGHPLANPLSHSAAGISVLDEYAALGGGVDAVRAVLAQVPRAAWDLTLGDVGLFFFAPCAVLMVSWRRGSAGGEEATPLLRAMARAGLVIFAIDAALHVLLPNGLWTGGASWGPRYLLYAAIPAAFTAAHGSGRWPARAVRVVAALSLVITWVGVQYGYSTSLLASLGHFLVGGPTTPAFRWLWLHWALVPTPERVALVWAETPRIGAYYAFTHPSPFAAYLALGFLLVLTWLPILKERMIHRHAM